ncbi:MAG: rpmJ [Mycobacterium sp.]|nr:rpmJ [Mycobacterium sp.]
MKVRNSLAQLKNQPGSIVVRRRGRTVVVNKKNPRWNARQG